MFNYNLEKNKEAESIVNYSDSDYRLLYRRNETGINNQNQQMIQNSFLAGLGCMTLWYNVCVHVCVQEVHVYGMNEGGRGM